MQRFSKPLTVPSAPSIEPAAKPLAKAAVAPVDMVPVNKGQFTTTQIYSPKPPVQLIPGYRRPPPRETTPTRRGWEEFPSAYAERLRETQYTLPLKLGPMPWNDARFAQRELRYYFRALANAAKRRDEQAAPLHQLAQRLRISCPRTEDDPNMHWVILKPNPLS